MPWLRTCPSSPTSADSRTIAIQASGNPEPCGSHIAFCPSPGHSRSNVSTVGRKECAMATASVSSNVVLYGTDEAPAPIRRFALGPLAFDLEAGKLRYIRFEGHEALRAIAFVVRGPSWESPAPAISGFESDERDGRLHIRYSAHYETAGGQLEVVAIIDAERQGGIVFEARAQALTDFTTARTSFCILHPIEGVAGQEFDLTRPGETVDKVRFPDVISAHQPF